MQQTTRFPKRLAALLGLVVALAGALGALGAARPVAAACPQTECEYSLFCIANPGNNTVCADAEPGSGQLCKTRACNVE